MGIRITSYSNNVVCTMIHEVKGMARFPVVRTVALVVSRAGEVIGLDTFGMYYSQPRRASYDDPVPMRMR